MIIFFFFNNLLHRETNQFRSDEFREFEFQISGEKKNIPPFSLLDFF